MPGPSVKALLLLTSSSQCDRGLRFPSPFYPRQAHQWSVSFCVAGIVRWDGRKCKLKSVFLGIKIQRTCLQRSLQSHCPVRRPPRHVSVWSRSLLQGRQGTAWTGQMLQLAIVSEKIKVNAGYQVTVSFQPHHRHLTVVAKDKECYRRVCFL
jgi:hypothetical protein